MKIKNIKQSGGENANTGGHRQNTSKLKTSNLHDINQPMEYNNNMSSCTHSAKHVIESLLQTVENVQKEKLLVKKSVYFLRKSIIKEEENRFLQMLAKGQQENKGLGPQLNNLSSYSNNVADSFQDKMTEINMKYSNMHSIKEEAMPMKGKQQNRRPFSGKIEKVYNNQNHHHNPSPSSKKSIVNTKGSNRVHYRPSTYSIRNASPVHRPVNRIQSSKILPGKQHASLPTSIHEHQKNKQPPNHKLFALQLSGELSDGQRYSEMRRMKREEENMQKQKDDWMKKAQKQEKEYPLLQSRFMMGKGNINFYYSSNGQIIQPKQKLNKVKRSKHAINSNIKSVNSINPGTSKKAIANDTIFVRYQGRDTYQSSKTCKQFQIQVDTKKICGINAKYTFLHS